MKWMGGALADSFCNAEVGRHSGVMKAAYGAMWRATSPIIGTIGHMISRQARL
jgi:hypothetical protein